MLRHALCVTAITALAACDPVGVAEPVAMLNGDLVVTPPAGYCADPVSSRLRAGFAVLAPCMTLGTEAPLPAILGVATVQAGDPSSAMVAGDESDLRNFLVSPQGAGLLGTPGSGGTISVLSSQAFDGRVTVHFRDSGTPPLDGLGPDEWRAFTDLGGRLVTVSVRGLAEVPLSASRGASLLDQMVRGLSQPAGTDAPDS
ncbi:MAG: dihydroxy-acid dehydratase [Loktanella sp.]|nr:dihydroxy-acid dehydratase [Loktanella sp.]